MFWGGKLLRLLLQNFLVWLQKKRKYLSIYLHLPYKYRVELESLFWHTLNSSKQMHLKNTSCQANCLIVIYTFAAGFSGYFFPKKENRYLKGSFFFSSPFLPLFVLLSFSIVFYSLCFFSPTQSYKHSTHNTQAHNMLYPYILSLS